MELGHIVVDRLNVGMKIINALYDDGAQQKQKERYIMSITQKQQQWVVFKNKRESQGMSLGYTMKGFFSLPDAIRMYLIIE